MTAELKPIKLNEPNKKQGLPLMETLAVKESAGSWSEKDLSMQDLSDLLWAACGINRPKIKKYTNSSAMNTHEVDLFLFNPGHLQDRTGKGVFRLSSYLRSVDLSLPPFASKNRYTVQGSDLIYLILPGLIRIQVRIHAPHRQLVRVDLILIQQILGIGSDRGRNGGGEKVHHFHWRIQLGQHLPGLGGESELGQTGEIEAMIGTYADGVDQQDDPAEKGYLHRGAQTKTTAPAHQGSFDPFEI